MNDKKTDAHVGAQVGAAVTRWLNTYLGRSGAKAFDPSSADSRAGGVRWRKLGWDFGLVTKAVELRCVDLADNKGGRYLRPRTLYNMGLDDYVAMVREGETPDGLRSKKSKPNGSSRRQQAQERTSIELAKLLEEEQ